MLQTKPLEVFADPDYWVIDLALDFGHKLLQENGSLSPSLRAWLKGVKQAPVCSTDIITTPGNAIASATPPLMQATIDDCRDQAIQAAIAATGYSLQAVRVSTFSDSHLLTVSPAVWLLDILPLLKACASLSPSCSLLHAGMYPWHCNVKVAMLRTYLACFRGCLRFLAIGMSFCISLLRWSCSFSGTKAPSAISGSSKVIQVSMYMQTSLNSQVRFTRGNIITKNTAAVCFSDGSLTFWHRKWEDIVVAHLQLGVFKLPQCVFDHLKVRLFNIFMNVPVSWRNIVNSITLKH